MEGFYRRARKSDDELLENTFFAVLNTPPKARGINRTTWIMSDLRRAPIEEGRLACARVTRKIIRDAGYTLRKAREAKIPPPGKARLTDAAEQIVALYGARGKPGEAASWRVKLGLPPGELPASVFAP